MPTPFNRRDVLAGFAIGSGSMAYASSGAPADETSPPVAVPPDRRSEWLDVKNQFKAHGDGMADDTHALQAAIDAGSSAQRPVAVPPGVYRITQPLTIPSNTMLMGSAPGLGFGCRIEPESCPAFNIGGKTTSFQCAIENLMIWPKHAAPDYVISIDNSYSVTFRNIRIHEVQRRVTRAAVLLLGDATEGGHGNCNNIIWDNLIVRNDVDQPGIAILAAKGCGTHRFFAPDLENYNVLMEWKGGGIDFIAPYTERAGRFAINCEIDGGDESAYFNTFGGVITAAASGTGCAIRATTRNFNSFGTSWGSEGVAAHAYDVPNRPVNFYGTVPNFGSVGRSRFSGVAGWRRTVRFPDHALVGSRSLKLDIPSRGHATAEIAVPGVTVGEAWARAEFNADSRGALLRAYVSAADTVTVIAQNPNDAPLSLSGVLAVECGIVSSAL
jgi:hypothetical protein